MSKADHTWVLVLAAGEGTRLQSLTTNARGVAIPKQYCALNGHDSLLLDAIHRGDPLARRERIMLIVAEQHRHWWQPCLSMLPTGNIVVQPQNRGTGNGILLPLLSILDRDPDANIVLLPSDHYVHDEGVLQESIKQAVVALQESQSCMVMLGITPEETDTDLGYIVPGFRAQKGTFTERRFVEKPDARRAEQLIRFGAVWNSFIIVASGIRLLELYARQFPDVVAAMLAAHQARASDGGQRLQSLYEALPTIDFSRHVLNGAEPLLRMLRVPACQWSDLGTPRRVADCISTMNLLSRRQRKLAPGRHPVVLDLVEAHRCLDPSVWHTGNHSSTYTEEYA